MSVGIQYETLKAQYRAEEARGIPMSVRERYGRSLADLRGKLRGSRHVRLLGEILLDMGAIDRVALEEALGEQQAEGGALLLGDVLVRRGRTDEETIRRAAEKQSAELGQGELQLGR